MINYDFILETVLSRESFAMRSQVKLSPVDMSTMATEHTEKKFEQSKDPFYERSNQKPHWKRPATQMDRVFNEEAAATFISYILSMVQQRKTERYQPVGQANENFLDLPANEKASLENALSMRNRLEQDFKRLDDNSQREVRKIISNMRYLDRVSSSKQPLTSEQPS